MIIEGNKGKITGEITVPGDKSISHRSIIIGSLAEGKTIIKNILDSKDVERTIFAFKKMGVDIEELNGDIHIEGVGLKGLSKPDGPIDCGNSGTTARLLSGVLVGQDFPSRLVGDDSLSSRPMDRIIIPLKKMGANIRGRLDKILPLEINPTRSPLKGIEYRLPVASAQVKSAILLSSLYADGRSKIIEPKASRDHTERMLKYFGYNILNKDNLIYTDSESKLKGKKIYIPGDISSASYFIVAATIVEDSDLIIKDVGINPTRTGIIYVLEKMGANIKILNKRTLNNEPLADIHIKYAPLKGISIGGDIIATLIDEIPIIAVAASLAEGRTIIQDASELKYKESNRISSITNELRKMGVNIEELSEGMIIEGNSNLKSVVVDSYGDHRIAMALSIAALRAEGTTEIKDYECVKISYPNFYKILQNLRIEI